MKKLYIIFAFVFAAALTNAAIIPITVGASSFSPNSVPAICGDTIIWIWGQSGAHTTTSTTIPGCATSWDAPISISSLTFAITVPCAGTYNYKCTPHTFTGSITVTCPNGVTNIDNNYFSAAYPNPFSNKLTIEFSGADLISFYNVLGEKTKTIVLAKGQTKAEISASDIREGIYFYCIIKEGVVTETRKIVKN
ncbi:MAG: T9SS type A sorting domain-containing protein [Bacteroidetes bacterium]|nr:MAG: T9SS type A sorting domain-containing protein [Bacteroidota bacterium]